jgi:dsRNA-specific ribonuclease
MLYAHGSDLCHDLELRHAMANCFEALMGALFLDGGIEVRHICSYQSSREIPCIRFEVLMAVSIL